MNGISHDLIPLLEVKDLGRIFRKCRQCRQFNKCELKWTPLVFDSETWNRDSGFCFSGDISEDKRRKWVLHKGKM
ncbi:hypothetical protein KQX54_003768 [Cotesia glomerata]|uniref:Uncharacterized protein n=1 Tax=Cotesia glomerata TaxID=32391 RepID=A0AAV7IT76_COTGL|nr:hypothetical protein KQX54_003768 [Cotesia glomerata]